MGLSLFPTRYFSELVRKKVRKDGKRVKKRIKKLANKGYLLIHKKGKTLSLNPSMRKEIIEFIEEEFYSNC